MDRKTYQLASLAVLATTMLVVAACNSSSNNSSPDPDPVPVTGNAYNGPGSKWDVDLNDDGTFQITRRPDVNSAIDLTIDGTYVRNPMGFVLMTVVSATGVDAPSQGDTAWAIEAEGYALMLYTEGDSYVPMVKSGTCATEDFTGNWVIARKRSDADATEVDGDSRTWMSGGLGIPTGTV